MAICRCGDGCKCVDGSCGCATTGKCGCGGDCPKSACKCGPSCKCEGGSCGCAKAGACGCNPKDCPKAAVGDVLQRMLVVGSVALVLGIAVGYLAKK